MWRGVRYYCQTKWRRLRNYCHVLQSMYLGTGGDGSFNLYGKSSRLGLQREYLRTQNRSLHWTTWCYEPHHGSTPLDTLHLWREERIQASRKAGPWSKLKSFSWVILRVKSKAAIVLTLDRHTMSYQFILNSKYNLDQYSLLLDQYYLLADVILSTAVRNVKSRWALINSAITFHLIDYIFFTVKRLRWQ